MANWDRRPIAARHSCSQTLAPRVPAALTAVPMTHDILIVGAGIAGLSLARALTAFGRTPVVLERSRGVGGRCATRRVDGQAVDHGTAFLHGRTPRFLAEMSVAGGVDDMADWPQLREGTGVPCQPAAFDPHDPRRAPAAGVNALAKHLARDLDVRLGARVDALALTPAPDAPGARLWTVGLASGDRLLARTVALAPPVPSVQALLTTINPPDPAVVRPLPLLNLVHAVPCLTVIARYPLDTPRPAWHASYPRDSAAVQTILHDSSKRAGTPRLTLVIQARPAFSQQHLDAPDDTWTRTPLAQAAALHGHWAGAPDLVQSHRWRYVRVVAGTALASPLVAHCEDGPTLGIAGDGLHPSVGVEGAYLSGSALAERLTGPVPRA